MSDHEDDGLEDLEPLSPEDEQAVSALLASLPREPMPSEVFSRIEAALAAEPAPVPLAPVVNLNAPSRRKKSRGPMIFKVAASVVGLVGAVALGLAVVQNGGGSSDAGSTADSAGGGTKSAEAAASTPALAAASGSGAGAASSAASSASSAIPAAGQAPRLSQTRFRYDQGNLASAATALVTGQAQPSPSVIPDSLAASSSVGSDTSAGGTTSYSTQKLVTTSSLLDSCVKEITDGGGRTPVAVDAGLWNNEPAVVIVLPALDDTTSLEVFVVKASCGSVKDSSDLLTFTNIPRP